MRNYRLGAALLLVSGAALLVVACSSNNDNSSNSSSGNSGMNMAGAWTNNGNIHSGVRDRFRDGKRSAVGSRPGLRWSDHTYCRRWQHFRLPVRYEPDRHNHRFDKGCYL